MKKLLIASALAAILTLAACTTRSISETGRSNDDRYRGELSEMQVLGVTPDKTISESEILTALNSPHTISMKECSRVVLVQSGSGFPDGELVDAMKKHFSVIPMSGIPDNNTRFNNDAPEQRLDKALRLSAARAGASTVVVVWGVLESASKNHVTKTISWLPIVGMIIPDQTQDMRIRLRAAVVDVETGAWEMVMPEVYQSSQLSSSKMREYNDAEQVLRLKAKAYDNLATTLVGNFCKYQ